MGYSVRQTDCDIYISERFFKKAKEALEGVCAEKYCCFVGALKANQFEVEISVNERDIIDITYEGSSMNQVTAILNALIPFVREENFLAFVGEDGDKFRLVFRKGEVLTLHPKISWK